MRAIIHTNHKEDLFSKGFKALGFQVTKDNGVDPKPTDILLVWNVTSRNKPTRDKFKRAGARILVAENGYIGKDNNGNKLLALAWDGHAGEGIWNIGDYPRYLDHNFDILPWKDGKNIVILAQRGIGNAKDVSWARQIALELKKKTDKPIIIREHKGRDNPPLEPVLDNAYCCVTWSSGAAIKAIAYGVPVFYSMPNWIGAKAAFYGLDIDNPCKGDRIEMFHRLGWAQWTRAEIESGEALKLCGCI